MNNSLMLGRKVDLPSSPDEATLDVVPAPMNNDTNDPGNYPYKVGISSQYLVRFSCPEFTSLCPVTGQPDFAHIVIDYLPNKLLVESKALKLFLGAFRNHAEFHEACACRIGQRIMIAAEPQWLRVAAFFYPRGGIPIDIFWEDGDRSRLRMPVPPIDISTYRAR